MAASSTPTAPTEVFFSYAHEDEPFLGELLKHLGILKRLGVIHDWHDRKITAGTEWKGQIDHHLDTAGVILLLVSADFVASDYCWDVELTRALERHDRKEARVIPVILRHVDGWHAAPFGKLQAVPTDGRPVTDWPNRDEAFADVAGHIRRGRGGTPKPLAGPSPTRGTAAVGRRFWTVPYPRNEFFEGREAVIADLRKQLTKRRKAALAQAITGLGGIGKTQTAVEYAYRYRDKYKAVLWLNAESALGLKTGSAELAGLLHLPHPENDLDAAVLAFKQWLKTEAGWLLILDNADDPALLTPFLPEAEHGHILITSRAQDFQDLGIIDPVGLEELSVDDATAFLLHRCGRQDAEAAERAAATDLARELDGLPLALEQAAAYIVERRATFQRYLESYRTRGLKLVDARLPALGQYPKSVATTWAANFEAVEEESPAAADVLRFSAFLAPDAIPFELLTRGALGTRASGAAEPSPGPRGPPPRQRPAPAAGPLLADSHRRARRDLQHPPHGPGGPQGRDGRRRPPPLGRACRPCGQPAFPPVEYDNWPLCGRLLPHALAVAPWIERDRMEFAEAGRLLNQTASYLYERGQYAEAEPLYQQAMEIHRTALGERHPDYATSLNNLAELYRAMGRHAEAEPLYQQAMEIRRTALGERHPDYATSLNNLAGLYRAMGRHAEAEPLYSSRRWRFAARPWASGTPTTPPR